MKMGYFDDINAMSGNQVHGNMNNINGFVSSIVQSEDLVNTAHLDVDDGTESIATWTELEMGKSREWYFLMPNVMRDKKSIVIRLRHGVTIKWDGRKIFHCSTVGSTGDNNHVYGTYFGNKN